MIALCLPPSPRPSLLFSQTARGPVQPLFPKTNLRCAEKRDPFMTTESEEKGEGLGERIKKTTMAGEKATRDNNGEKKIHRFPRRRVSAKRRSREPNRNNRVQWVGGRKRVGWVVTRGPASGNFRNFYAIPYTLPSHREGGESESGRFLATTITTRRSLVSKQNDPFTVAQYCILSARRSARPAEKCASGTQREIGRAHV